MKLVSILSQNIDIKLVFNNSFEDSREFYFHLPIWLYSRLFLDTRIKRMTLQNGTRKQPLRLLYFENIIWQFRRSKETVFSSLHPNKTCCSAVKRRSNCVAQYKVRTENISWSQICLGSNFRKLILPKIACFLYEVLICGFF